MVINSKFKTKKVFLALVLLMAISVLSIKGNAAEGDSFKETSVTFKTDDKDVSMNVWLALTPAEQERGLMFKHQLDDNIDGMLFVFDNKDYISMWMKNTYISLDMIFIDETGRVACIEKNTVPKSLDIVSCQKPVKYVMEILAGDSDKRGFSVGKTMMNIKENKFLQFKD